MSGRVEAVGRPSRAGRLGRLDRKLFRRAAAWHSPPLDAVLPRLSRSADHGVLWMVLSVPIALGGPRGRRAAARGLVSVGLATVAANVAVKLIVRRTRPALHQVPSVRRIRRQPISTSFPSGHAASAAAFATAVAMEAPELALPLGALAAAVAYSRVHTGVHYPGDVLAGAALGMGLALGTRGVSRVVPLRLTRGTGRSAIEVRGCAGPLGCGLVPGALRARARRGSALS